MLKYKFKVSLEKLGVSKYFQFNKSFKELVQRDSTSSIILDEGDKSKGKKSHRSQTLKKKQKRKNSFSHATNKPFERTIESLKEIPEINSPIQKLEYIYQIFNTVMVGEIDEFWEGV